MNLTKTLPIIACSLLFVGSLAVGVGARADSQGAEPIEVGVHSLNTRAGVAAVYHRIRGIAVGHCTRSVEQAPESKCVTQVMEQLLGRVADPYLSYLHENLKTPKSPLDEVIIARFRAKNWFYPLRIV